MLAKLLIPLQTEDYSSIIQIKAPNFFLYYTFCIARSQQMFI